MSSATQQSGLRSEPDRNDPGYRVGVDDEAFPSMNHSQQRYPERTVEHREWVDAEIEHQTTVDTLTANHRARSASNLRHPVEDFLFTYYTLRPAQLRRWYPGAGFALVDAGKRADWPFHRTIEVPGINSTVARSAVVVDEVDFYARRATTVQYIYRLLTATASAPPQFRCFGLHEWAIIYRAPDRRHLGWPLRLGLTGTDDVVENHTIKCSHFDAFRFFTPEARSRNALSPAQDTRVEMEQPACLHASMDLYKWAYRLVPVVTSSTLVDCFRLARDARTVDMRASPYDFTDLGHLPIAIETAAGKGEYVALQRQFSERGRSLRKRLCQEMESAFGTMLTSSAPASPPA